MTSDEFPHRDSLDDFALRRVTLLRKTKRVYTAGTGPAVIVMTEMPGITPQVARFARRVRDAGFTVYMPDLFGVAGADGSRLRTILAGAKLCISREFHLLRSHSSGPIADWLRGLCALAHNESGGRGVGAIGMCVTGNFALSMMLEPSMLAPVLSQPSLPLMQKSGLHIAPAELEVVRQRLQREDLTVRAYRFRGDRFCRAERFTAYEAVLGDSFSANVIEDDHANPRTRMKNPHSVVTNHLIDAEGEPTKLACDEILAFFAARLRE